MKNESENVAFLTEAIAGACAPYAPFEAIYIDDASTDDTARKILELRERFPFLRLLRHDTSGGQSAAIHSGVRAARGAVICTLDGDGQNPPAEIPKLLAQLRGQKFPPGIGLVAGQRVGRQDTASKRWASKAANAIRSSLLRDGTRDTGCGLKVFDRDGFLALPYFDHMHRYLPALFNRDGWGIVHVDVAHAARHAGTSNYANLGRALVGIYDLFGVMWLLRRRKKARAVEVAPPEASSADLSRPSGPPPASTETP
jgi:dolichol-phosphate mannosyltransferase